MKSIFTYTNYVLKRFNYELILFRTLNTKSNKMKLVYSSTIDPMKRDETIYEDIFAIYEKIVYINTFGQHPRWRTSFVKHLAPFENIKILDAAGGTGLTTREILNQTEMMQIGQKKMEHLQNIEELVHFVECDVHNLPFKNDEFDLATFTFSFRTGINIDQVFKELFRVVKPGGKVGVLDFCYSKNPKTVQWLYNLFLDHIYSKLADFLWKKPEVAYYLADNIRRSPSKDQVVEMLKGAGFLQISTKSYMGGVTYHYIGCKLNPN